MGTLTKGLSFDRRDSYKCEVLSVTALDLRALSPALLEDHDLSRATLVRDLSLDLGSFDLRATDAKSVSFSKSQDVVEHDLLALLPGELLHAKLVSFFDPVLLATGSDHSVHLLFLFVSLRPAHYEVLELHFY